MAGPYYVDSTASGADDGSSWTNAYPSIELALEDVTNQPVAGDVFYVSSSHAFAPGGATINYNEFVSSSAENPVVFISANSAASPPTAYARTASETNTGSNNTINFGNDGSIVFIGFDFTTAEDFVVNVDACVSFYDCTFTITGTSAANIIRLRIESFTYFENCEFTFGGVGQFIDMESEAKAKFVNCTLGSGTAALNTRLFDMEGGGNVLEINGFDLSLAAVGLDLLESHGAGSNGCGTARCTNIKMKTAWSGDLMYNTPGHNGDRFEAYGISDDSDEMFDTRIDCVAGSVRTSTGTVLDATYDGTNKYSWQMTCIASTDNGVNPMWHKVAEYWADANQVHTIEITSANALDTSKVWIQVESPNTTTATLSEFVDTRETDYFLGTAGALTAGTGAWTSGRANDYQLSATVTNSQAGVHRLWIYLASDAAETINVDPLVVVSAP